MLAKKYLFKLVWTTSEGVFMKKFDRDTLFIKVISLAQLQSMDVNRKLDNCFLS